MSGAAARAGFPRASGVTILRSILGDARSRQRLHGAYPKFVASITRSVVKRGARVTLAAFARGALEEAKASIYQRRLLA